MHVLDIFTGIGGLTLTLPSHSVALYVENNLFCQNVIQKRIADGLLPPADIHNDVRTLTGSHIAFQERRPDFIAAGFPCQDISVMGKRVGLQGSCSSLIFEVLRLANELGKPTIWLENVQRLMSVPDIWKPVFTALTSLGYSVTWTLVGAGDCGAPHRRNRWFALCKHDMCSTGLLGLHERLPKHGSTHMCRDYCIQPTVPRRRVLFAEPKLIKGSERHTHAQLQKYIQRWATPRSSCIGSSMHVNLRELCGDLPAQLRYAADTLLSSPELTAPNAKWVEWLMGFPANWTSIVDSPGSLDVVDWVTEPWDRIVKPSVENSKRLRALGNAVVPIAAQCAFEACNKFYDGFALCDHRAHPAALSDSMDQSLAMFRPVVAPHVQCDSSTMTHAVEPSNQLQAAKYMSPIIPQINQQVP